MPSLGVAAGLVIGLASVHAVPRGPGAPPAPPSPPATPGQTPERDAGSPRRAGPAPFTSIAVPKDSKFFLGEIRMVSEGHQFTEGPVWVRGRGERGFLLFSDVPGRTIWQVKGGEAAVLHKEMGRPNGLAVDAQGRIVVCESDGRIRRITADDPKGEVLAEAFEGRRLNSPNDLVIDSKGRIYFTDPAFFVRATDRRLDFEGLFCITPDGTLHLLDKDFARLNGVCLSPDESRLYVADFGGSAIYVYDLDQGKISNRRKFADVVEQRGDRQIRGRPDGVKTDRDGNVYTTGPGGVWVFSPSGELLEKLAVPGVSNIAFGGEDGRTLFMTAGTRVLAVPTVHAGW
jgi:gluconolactonase